MIDLKDFADRPEAYREDVVKRGLPRVLVDSLLEMHGNWKRAVARKETLSGERNRKSALVPKLPESERTGLLEELKQLAEDVRVAEDEAQLARRKVDELLPKIPTLAWSGVPIGASSEDNAVVASTGPPPTFSFRPRPYFELPLYGKWICQAEGVKSFGARGYYLRGPVARFQKALFDYAQRIILDAHFELLYPPVILNRDTLTATGHLPDFDGQQYEVALGDSHAAYLVGSSEPSLMAFFQEKTIGADDLPMRVTAWTTCFRKEAGSYGKDQKGIVRNHQFEKIEMVILCHAEESNERLLELQRIEKTIYDGLGLHYREVEVCTADLPKKHCRQIDFEAWFPGQDKYIEISSNGNAADYQTRPLGIRTSEKSQSRRRILHSLNCTGITFRAGLAILEQCQTCDGSVAMPRVLKPLLGFDTITA